MLSNSPFLLNRSITHSRSSCQYKAQCGNETRLLLSRSVQGFARPTIVNCRCKRIRPRLTRRANTCRTGSGIPEALQPNLFKPYVGQRGGTGLGLAIVKRIVDQSGWKISLDSRPGQGTTFTIGHIETIDGAKA